MDVLGCIYLYLGEWAETELGGRGVLRDCRPSTDESYASITIDRVGGGIMTIVIEDDHAKLWLVPGGEGRFEYDDPEFPLNLQAAVLADPTIDKVMGW